jgi:hypothetical protein
MSLRMADFGSFMASVAKVEGWGTEANAMLDETQDRQTEQEFGSNRIIALIRELFAKSDTTSEQSCFAHRCICLVQAASMNLNCGTKERLKLIIPIVFFTIFLLLCMVFHSAAEAMVRIGRTIYATTGCLLLQWLLRYNFNLSAG